MIKLLALMASILASAAPGDAGLQVRSLDVNGTRREYRLHLPAGSSTNQPRSIVLAFHGAMSNGRQTAYLTGLNAKADAEGFIAVYPEGSGRPQTWNGGNCCGPAAEDKVDDVAFTRAILDDLAKVSTIDRRRIFATGISNGGIFCYRLAAELSDRIAAIAPVAGTLGSEAIQPARPVSVIHFHGTDDDFVPIGGGRTAKTFFRIDFISVEQAISSWVKADGCPEKPVVVELPDKADPQIRVTRATYGPGKQGSEVVLYTVRGGGHTWPGHEVPIEFLGHSTKDISATDLMWEFFQRHPLP